MTPLTCPMASISPEPVEPRRPPESRPEASRRPPAGRPSPPRLPQVVTPRFRRPSSLPPWVRLTTSGNPIAPSRSRLSLATARSSRSSFPAPSLPALAPTAEAQRNRSLPVIIPTCHCAYCHALRRAQGRRTQPPGERHHGSQDAPASGSGGRGGGLAEPGGGALQLQRTALLQPPSAWGRRQRLLLHLSLIHISEPTRLRRNSYAVFCLTKKKETR